MIVVDASVAFEVVLRTPLGLSAGERLADEDQHAPHLVDVEIASALRRLVFAKEIGTDGAEEALLALMEWPLVRHAHTPLLPRIWALRHGISAYDACYVALAETLGAPLLTCDARLANAHGHSAKIELIG
jgi:predicted nucleic acid-binding protein